MGKLAGRSDKFKEVIRGIESKKRSDERKSPKQPRRVEKKKDEKAPT